ncbi:MAG: DUF3102 domain-containing protein, partial [Candidatus Sericytochromatia bacterium]
KGPDTGEDLDTITRKLHEKLAETAQNLVESGNLLLQAKEIIGHGNFKPWLRENFRMSFKTANRFMSVAKMVQHLQLKSSAMSDMLSLDLKTLYEVAAKSTSEDVQRQIFHELKQQHPVSYELVRLMKKQEQEPQSKSLKQQELDRFTRMLRQFNAWFEHLTAWIEQHQDWLELPLNEMPDEIRLQLESNVKKLKVATDLVEDMLAKINAISVVAVSILPPSEPRPAGPPDD